MNRNDFLKILTMSSIGLATIKLNALSKFAGTLENTMKMPVLFVGHGSPMNAIEENEFSKGWKTMATAIQKPLAILCISAHWETKGTWVTAMESPSTIHDFGGFPKALFDVEYPAPGDPGMAGDVKTAVAKTDIGLDYEWGLDHGCWSVVKQMYPEADIPVIQMSLDYTRPARYHFELARELGKLRDKGILILGSGNMVHNLGKIDWQRPDRGFDWAEEANEGFKSMIINEEYDKLLDIGSLPSAYRLSVPSPEHYLPLIYTLGLKERTEDISFFNDKTVMGSISMTSVKIS